jgi:hypothetical protein
VAVVSSHVVGEREPSAARTAVPIFAGLVILADMVWAAVALRLAASDVCVATDPHAVDDCRQRLVWQAGFLGLSVAFAACSIAVAVRARTAENAWKGGIVLLIAALVFSPLAGLVG